MLVFAEIGMPIRKIVGCQNEELWQPVYVFKYKEKWGRMVRKKEK
jgi:hypothetical protein